MTQPKNETNIGPLSTPDYRAIRKTWIENHPKYKKADTAWSLAVDHHGASIKIHVASPVEHAAGFHKGLTLIEETRAAFQRIEAELSAEFDKAMGVDPTKLIPTPA
jgi:hypothetical protein